MKAFLFCVFVSSTVFAGQGFNQAKVRRLLEERANDSGVTFEDYISAAFEAVDENELTRFLISTKGELLVLCGTELFVIVPICHLSGKAEVIICSCGPKAFRKNFSSIAFETDDLTVKEAWNNNFVFKEGKFPSSSFQLFRFEYEELQKQNRGLKRARDEEEDFCERSVQPKHELIPGFSLLLEAAHKLEIDD